MNRSLASAAGLGAVAGLRTMQGLAWVSHDLASRRVPRRATGLERWLARGDVATVIAGLATAELAADKLPFIPDRITLQPLLGRAMAGAVVGALAAGRDRQVAGAALGASAAVAAAFTAWFLRREVGRTTMLPDLAVALAEDALAVAVARSLVMER
jgi:uncharacterized membrane protein